MNLALYKTPEEPGLFLESRFMFRCHPGLACFNECCREPTVILSPYDLLRLKTRLGLTSGEILRRFTRRETEEASRLPLVLLKAGAGRGCPLVGPEGCTVYSDRPAACRLFPITQGSRWTEQGVEDHYFCRRLPFCLGFEAQEEWTVASWAASQGFGEYDAARRPWLEIILKKGLPGLPPGDPSEPDLFYLAAYDLDNFRKFVFESAFSQVYGLQAGQLEPLKTDDFALLKFAYRYLAAALFTRDVRKIREALRAAV